MLRHVTYIDAGLSFTVSKCKNAIQSITVEK